MKTTRWFHPLVLLLLASMAGAIPGGAQTSKAPAATGEADSAFKAGNFAAAEKLYAAAIRQDPGNAAAALRLGRLALLANRLEEAEKWLGKSLALQPGDKLAQRSLAEVYRRRDDFERAAPLLAAAGREAEAKKLASFKGMVPYQIEGPGQETHLKFVHTDPLPLVRVKVNGEEVNFILDTGGGEVILDPELAQKAGVVNVGSEKGTFAGGKSAEVGQGRLASLTLGEFVVRNVPVGIQSTRRFAAAARGKQVDGILGTVLLYHFVPTIDYGNGELVLRRRPGSNAKPTATPVAGPQDVEVPFWLAGDHLMLASGRVNQSAPVLLLVDTGAAGLGFTGPRSILAEAGIKLPAGPEAEGIGGGGAVKVTPFQLAELSLGAARETDIPSVYGAFPESLEWSNDFRIAGLISHQFFRPYALTLDFDRMKLTLRRGARAGT
jgi:predicted aspartyl protease